MNQEHTVRDKPSIGNEKASKKDRRSRPDALGLLSSLVSHDEGQLQYRSSSASREATTRHVTFAKMTSTCGSELMPQQSSSSYSSELTPSSSRLESYRNLYSYGYGSSSRTSSKDEPEGVDSHDGQGFAILPQVETLSKKNEKCVRRTLSQDWLKRTFSPRPCMANERGTIGSLSTRKRQSLVSISEENEDNGDDGSDLSDSKSGVEERSAEFETIARVSSLSLTRAESAEARATEL
eukprot:TRINITY_DN463_c0_g1_i1.p1 TRINITY_DN463_c0_g1~~TRINITY_DN463_c0_g1_i1.p1  ORF type:complete len:237 (-),score=26.78 TRINITY_DN463_c0_g1_i1:682-1392(-)